MKGKNRQIKKMRKTGRRIKDREGNERRKKMAAKTEIKK